MSLTIPDPHNNILIHMDYLKPRVLTPQNSSAFFLWSLYRVTDNDSNYNQPLFITWKCHNLNFSLCSAISSPEFSGSSVSGGSPGRTLGTRNFYRRNRAVPVLVRMLGWWKTEVIEVIHEVNFFQCNSAIIWSRKAVFLLSGLISCFWNWSWLSI